LFFALLFISCDKSDNDSTFIPQAKDSSTFSINFIDVGQGDSALVECDGRYMLIDGGDKVAGDRVYFILVENNIQHLDILAISHFHDDHIGGLTKALSYASKIDKTIANANYREDSKTFKELEHQLGINGSQITVPNIGDKFKLGSADIEVVDVAAESANDSLVLLITYGETRFLFTGDIEYNAQTRISDKYQNENDDPYVVDLIKMPHHGSYTGSLYRFIRTFNPDYAIISVGEGNLYRHPHEKTLDLLEDADLKVYRTDINGDILVRSNGKELSIETRK
jgi:competence protein ComEC